MFNLWYYNSEFSTGHMQENDPFSDLVMVDDLMLPLNSLPEYMQTIVKEARAQGKEIAFTSEDPE
ncbi:hypothetical protein L1967_12225 [Zunongwangia sp. M21534]|nr:hypothetical protein [Zunongwangia pacifica]